jgi:hypothetical protein
MTVHEPPAGRRAGAAGPGRGAPRRGGGPPGPRRAPPAIPNDVLWLLGLAMVSSLGALGLSKRFRVATLYVSVVILGAAGLWVAVFPRLLAMMPANY